MSGRNPITRRDFLNGVAIGIGATLVSARLGAAEGPSDYPPAWTGTRGSTDVSAAVAHALRDGQPFAIDTRAPEGEVDLAVVGADISGLAAAYYFRQRHPSARILILDNHRHLPESTARLLRRRH